MTSALSFVLIALTTSSNQLAGSFEVVHCDQSMTGRQTSKLFAYFSACLYAMRKVQSQNK